MLVTTFYLIPVSYPGSGLELMALFSRYTGVRKHPVMYSCNQYYFPGGSHSKESACKAGRPRVQSLGWEDPWRRAWQPTPVLLPGESHGQRSLAGCSPWGRRVGLSG